MTKVLEAIQGYLKNRANEVPGGDLIRRWTPDMETQVFVHAGEHGEPVESKRSTYSDGINEWWHIRVPSKADSDPIFTNYELPWLIRERVEAIGCTGWDWKNRRSRWFGFDFDAITGHAEGIGVSDDELQRIKERACDIPYVEVRHSTSGRGLHLYVMVDGDGIETENHTVHQALARAVLTEMSTLANFNFGHAVDACGGNMWIDHRNIQSDSIGLKLVKPAERMFRADEVSADWRNHQEVVTRNRPKVRVEGVPDDEQDEFDRLTSSRRHVALDDKHKAIMDAVAARGATSIWVADHHLWQTHTYALAQVMEHDKEELGLVGYFATNSGGTDLATPNCYCFPEPDGVWRVIRFGHQCSEVESWQISENGWTNTLFNTPLDFETTMRIGKGVELPDEGGFQFQTTNLALMALESWGRVQVFECTEALGHRSCDVKLDKVGNVTLQVERVKTDPESGYAGWAKKGKRVFIRVLRKSQTSEVSSELEKLNIDDRIRRCRNSCGSSQGYYYSAGGSDWYSVCQGEIKDLMEHLGVAKPELNTTRGQIINNVWDLVTMPFRPEYPGDRLWNRDAPQYKHKPSPPHEGDASPHPYWDMILDHVGQSLDKPLRGSEWARNGGIHRGRDYLTHWIACLLREPQEPLPYLFLYGPQNSGKSILHEGIQTLLTKGVVFADRVLGGRDHFNGELEGALVCVVEETDLSRRKAEAYNRIKEFVTSRTLSIRKMHTDASSTPNYTHWIQCANEQGYCPVLPGDTRINVMYVPPIQDEIPKSTLLQRLDEEGPAFMRTLLDLRLIRAEGRLRLPVVENDHKKEVMEDNRHPLECFLENQCYEVPGKSVPFTDFFSKFLESLPSDLREVYKESEIRKLMARQKPLGLRPGEGYRLFIGNLTFDKHAKPSIPLKKVHRSIVPDTEA